MTDATTAALDRLRTVCDGMVRLLRDLSAAEADDDRWRTRVVASTAGGLPSLAHAHAELSAAVMVSASRVDGSSRVGTQGHVLTVDDLLDTLTVEATVHHRWDDTTAVRRGTGREPLDADDRPELGDAVGALPLLA